MSSGLLVSETSFLSDFAGHVLHRVCAKGVSSPHCLPASLLAPPLHSLLRYLGDSCANNIHPTFLLVFFCFAESRQLKRVCLGMGAVQVLMSVHRHCTLSHWHLSTGYFKMSTSMAGKFINRHEPCKKLYNSASPCGPSPKGRT